MPKKRTEVADIDRSMYDFRYEEKDFERVDAGLTPEIVEEISSRKDEPQWMLDFRLKSLETYHRMATPDWGPSIAGLDMDNIVTYVKPNTDQKSDWESLPDDVKNTFDRLGIPQAERAYLAGVGAQYDIRRCVGAHRRVRRHRIGRVPKECGREADADPRAQPFLSPRPWPASPSVSHTREGIRKHGAAHKGLIPPLCAARVA